MFEIMLSEHRAVVQDGLSYALIIIALVWGGGPERVFAIGWLVLFEFGSVVIAPLVDNSPTAHEISWLSALIDTLALLFWTASALYANRNYTLWIAAMQVLAVASHLSRAIVESISPISYAVMALTPGWLQLLFFAIGLTRHIQRRRLHGPYRDWRVSRTWAQLVPERPRKWSLTTILGYDFFAVRSER